MTDLRKAAEMALEALEELKKDVTGKGAPEHWDAHYAKQMYALDALDALRQALAQPEQKPVAYMGTDIDGNPNKFRLNHFGGAIGLYTKEQL